MFDVPQPEKIFKGINLKVALVEHFVFTNSPGNDAHNEPLTAAAAD